MTMDMDIINSQNDPEAFAQLCHELKIDYPSVVHHFERDSRGIYMPVFWGEIKSVPSEGRK